MYIVFGKKTINDKNKLNNQCLQGKPSWEKSVHRSISASISFMS